MQIFVGTILLVPDKFDLTQLSTQYLLCGGGLVSLPENEELFALLGTSYGGDGYNTFGVPTLTSPLMGFKYVICTKGILPEYNH